MTGIVHPLTADELAEARAWAKEQSGPAAQLVRIALTELHERRTVRPGGVDLERLEALVAAMTPGPFRAAHHGRHLPGRAMTNDQHGDSITMTKTDRYVIVATASRPWTIAAGILESEPDGAIILRDARMIVYWSSDTRALFGVAARGMCGAGRVTSAVSRARIRNVEIVLDATDEARRSIEAEPWT